MTQRKPKTLTITRDRLRRLDGDALAQAAGGSSSIRDWEYTCGTNFIISPPTKQLPRTVG